MSDVHAAEAAQESIVNAEVNETEQKARRLGWVPKEEFKGDPSKHRSADEFLERGTTILPILQRDNEKLHARLTEVESALNETREASKQLLEFTTKSEKRAYERAKAEIQARVEQAAANADPAAVRAEMANLDALDKQHEPAKPKEPTPKTSVAVDPEIQSWIGREEWFTRDRTLNAYAVDTYGELERDKPGLTKSEMLAETKRRTMAKFPEKFGINPARDGAATVASPSGQTVTTRKRGKSFDDLPEEAKRACDRFVKNIPGYTREQYVKDYDWES